jgi:predicted GNAT family acetyltransferase
MRDGPARDEPAPVVDNGETGRFEITIGGETAYQEYSRGPAELVLVHTEVPSALSGRGLASRLTRHGLELARREGLRVALVCPFALGWVDRHPEYRDLLDRPGGTAAPDLPWM